MCLVRNAYLLIIAFLACAVSSGFAQAKSSGKGISPAGAEPLIAIYAKGDLPVENVSVAVTNTLEDRAILITSLEFDGQLPETRYFHHGIYGEIGKQGTTYVHYSMRQQLSRPVGSCFLLPKQSAQWERPLRLVPTGYRALVSWREIPVSEVARSLWFCGGRDDPDRSGSLVYEPLLPDQQDRYRNMSAGRNGPPLVVLEGDFPEKNVVHQVPCISPYPPADREERLRKEGWPKGSVEFSLSPVADSVVISGERIVCRRYDDRTRKYEPVDLGIQQPMVADFLFIHSRDKDPKVPCLLNSQDFGDLIEVRVPSQGRYLDPGITSVPFTLLPKILQRAKERDLAIQLRRIDPNSLGMQLVLSISRRTQAPSTIVPETRQ